jgi:type IV secretory pathway VirB3-like protein
MRIARIALAAFTTAAVVVGVTIDLIQLDAGLALSAFTIQSNILAGILALVTLVRTVRRNDPDNAAYVFFKGLALTSIFLTFVVFNLLLRTPTGLSDADPAATLASELLHVVVPLATLADYLVFEKKGNIRTWHPFAWTSFPWCYVAYTAIWKAFGGVYRFSGTQVEEFPYFFMDYVTYGWPTVIVWVLLINAGFIAFGFSLYGIDRLLRRRPHSVEARLHA